jgi:hypothetical protein
MSQIDESGSTLDVPASEATTATASTSTLAEGEIPTVDAIRTSLKGSHRPRSRCEDRLGVMDFERLAPSLAWL